MNDTIETFWFIVLTTPARAWVSFAVMVATTWVTVFAVFGVLSWSVHWAEDRASRRRGVRGFEVILKTPGADGKDE